MTGFEHIARVAVLFACGVIPLSAMGQTEFGQCVARLKTLAVERGVTTATAEQVLSDVTRLERVIAADRNQPEFVESLGRYVGRRVTAERVTAGRLLLREHRSLLSELTAQFGIPGQYVVAFWGLETNYGRVLGRIPVFDALTMLACDQRRGEYFAAEVVSALHIVDRGDVEVDDMIGSWAGAVGHTQFMPSRYLTDAVDGDGDGRIDLWNSVPDALASAAGYLSGLSWQRGLRWGREILLPEAFDYYASGMDKPRSLREWHSLGITDVNGDLMPELDIEAALLLPAGRTGPGFLVYENFHVIMRWNRAELFALSVGHLADRIAGGSPLTVEPPVATGVTRQQVAAVQTNLNARGHDSGEPDGLLGPMTRNAIRDFQRASGLIADGFPDTDVLTALGVE